MGDKTGISWTNKTWNPWHGCIKVSPGCKNCYMYTDKKRYGQDPMRVQRSKTTFKNPLKWQRIYPSPIMVFTCSWSDFFIKEADEWRDEAWEIIRQTPNCIYQILTKRPERIAEHLPEDWGNGWPNVWLGVSVENQAHADERLEPLLRLPDSPLINFLSAEPLLGPLDITKYLPHKNFWLSGAIRPLNWVIVGGESGPGCRPMDPQWARDIRDQCKLAGVPFFFKQHGGTSHDKGGDLLDGVRYHNFPER